jgi:alkanesulfonate monooxygenase SsuD/methylene tetrahydromethanopterin reductase-like flavin-dependent oxidoreductase (luciferase family)
MPDPAAFAAQFANPALWWNTVQDQFTQAVNQVVAPAKKSAGRKPAAAKKTPAKKTASAAKKTTASRTRKKSKM